MSVKTTYKCDKCGAEQDTDDQFWTVGIYANCQCLSDNKVTGKSLQVCRLCLEELGIYAETKINKDLMPVPIPTVEDLIRTIMERVAE
jgi:hypothetical protein